MLRTSSAPELVELTRDALAIPARMDKSSSSATGRIKYYYRWFLSIKSRLMACHLPADGAVIASIKRIELL